MSSLTRTEARRFEKLLGMGPGYVLDFSNNRFKEFVEDSTGLDIYDAKYTHGGSGSKANQLRGFWNAEPDAKVGKLLGDLLGHGVEIGAFKADDEPSLVACRQTVLRLLPTRSADNAPQSAQSGPSEREPQIVNHFYASVGNVAQNSKRFSQTAGVGFQPGDLAKLVTELTAHLDELNLDARQKQRAQVQIAALQAELDGDPDPGILQQAGRTLRNIIEGAIGSLLATAVQPGVWHWVQQTLAGFGSR